MTAARLFGVLLLATGALALSALFATRLAHTVSAPRHATAAKPSPTPSRTRSRRPPHARTRRTRRHPHARSRQHAHARPRRDHRRRTHGSRAVGPPRHAAERRSGPHVFGVPLVVLVGVEGALALVSLGGLACALVVRRIRRRGRREYALYELHLSPHDEAKPQDLEDAMEATANIIRAFPAERARSGQPHVAIELICEPGPSGAMEWSIGVRCEPTAAVALDGALSAAYPDVRLGHVHGSTPRPRAQAARAAGHVMRFRKERSFVYPLLAAGDEDASPPLEAIAHAQISTGAPSVIRFQLTPPPTYFEDIARRLYRRHENRLIRAERWGLPEGGLTSTLNRAEMTSAQRTQNRSMFWLEVVVAADTRELCKPLAAALQARRGENRLHRRCMIVRQGLYRRRFPAALPPLLPSPRSLISAAEAAHLLALPTARMKGVPVRRVAIPRVPMPPEIMRAHPDAPVPAPPPPAPAATAADLNGAGGAP